MVLYDALANEELLSMLLKKALKIFVGKERMSRIFPRSNQPIDRRQCTYLWTRRPLKGGDPFIFGRGSEEIEL
jgi:uroporphyrin-III C-methyltransferase